MCVFFFIVFVESCFGTYSVHANHLIGMAKDARKGREGRGSFLRPELVVGLVLVWFSLWCVGCDVGGGYIPAARIAFLV